MASQRPDLSTDQATALARLTSPDIRGRCLFVTGKAGTGKSTLLRELVATSRLATAVLAPTGLAAIQVGGQTIHSFFALELGPLDNSPERVPLFRKGHPKRRLIEKLECLVIDEASMIRADVMDAIDFSLRQNCERPDVAFAGKTIVLFGDLWQLEPVVQAGGDEEMIRDRYASPFFFDSVAVREAGLEVINLTTVHRQRDDPEFLWALNQLRRGSTSELEFFNGRVEADLGTDAVVTLTATNARADAINFGRLAQLPGVARTYAGALEGNFGRDLPADPRLGLKIGAQVMFVKNGREWANGTLGTVVELDELTVTVQKADDGETVVVERDRWEKTRYRWNADSRRIETEIVGEYAQLPLRLAWAVTIHKSQGLTFDRVVVDLDRRAFAHGQLYVAMSRCRTLAGVSLRRALSPDDVQVSARVLEFERQMALE